MWHARLDETGVPGKECARDWLRVLNRQQPDATSKDVQELLSRVAQQPAEPDATWSGDAPDPARSRAPYQIFNIGNGQPQSLLKYIEALEDCLGRKARKEFLPMQPGDMPNTFADTGALEKAIGLKPATPLRQGVRQFVDWYKNYYHPARGYLDY